MKTFTIALALSLLTTSAFASTRDPLANVPACESGHSLTVTDSGWLDSDNGQHAADFHSMMAIEHLAGVPDSIYHTADNIGASVGVCQTSNNLRYFVR
jgi:hypothetical protein